MPFVVDIIILQHYVLCTTMHTFRGNVHNLYKNLQHTILKLWLLVQMLSLKRCVSKMHSGVTRLVYFKNFITLIIILYTIIGQRDSGIEQQSGRHFFVLYAYVPILEVAPAGWNLALVDTPGFGEANVDHITKHTDMLFSTSTAYLYLMDSTSMEDSIDGENIGLLFKHDKGIVT